MSQQSHKKIEQYTIGFGLSILLTIIAFGSVKAGLSSGVMIFVLVSLAITQLFVQLVFFLHLNKQQEPRWNLMMFLLAAWFVFAIVVGSVWIMANLDYNMMPEETETYLIDKEGIFKE